MIWLFITGVLAGIISGMGIGGGTVLIPSLTLIFGIEQKMAQTINLIYFIPTATAALVMHIKNKRIEKRYLLYLIIFGVSGAVIGSVGAKFISSQMLAKIFGGFLSVMGISEIVKGIRYKKR